MKKVLFLLLLLIGTQIYAQNAVETISKHLKERQKTLNLTDKDIENIIITDNYTSRHNGVNHVYFQQQHAGIPVFNAISNINISESGKVLNMGNRFVTHLAKKVNTTTPTISATQAVQAGARHLDLNFASPLTVVETSKDLTQKTTIEASDLSLYPIPVSLAYAPHKDGTVKLAWNLKIKTTDYQNYWNLRIDATNGELIGKYNQALHCSFHKPDVKCLEHGIKHKPIPPLKVAINAPNDYNIFAFPVESPNHGDRSIVNSPWEPAGADASPFGWHNDGNNDYTTTRGNNVRAQEDRNGNDGTGYSPESPNLDFNFPLDLNLPPSENQDAAITNLFYWCNIMHDVAYKYGFDELSGNFQVSNNGQGGNGNDAIQADAQDGSATNNAVFSTDSDGSVSRIQMFEWTSGGNAPPMSISIPPSLAGTYEGDLAGFDPPVPLSGLSGNLAIAYDGSANPTWCCEAIINTNEVAGNIALIERGDCFFMEKVETAQNAGAIAVVIYNNEPGNGTLPMGGAADYTGADLTIPVIMIGNNDAQDIISTLETGVPVSISMTGAVNLDGDFDNGIIAHEYSHGISIRLTGGPTAAGCLTVDEQMGEGWSDWYGLMLTMKAEDTRNTGRGYGTYASDEPTTGQGIREAPYTTNTNVNEYTYGDSNNGALFVPHGIGFVWATILWEVTWDMIDEYGFDPDLHNGTGGNNIMLQLVTDGLKLQTCNPGMVDGRDAILLADEVNYDGEHVCMLWEAFARRGLGFSASQGSSASRSDQVESFDSAPVCQPNLRLMLEANTDSVQAGENIGYTFTVTNEAQQAITETKITVNFPENATYVNGSSQCTESTSNGEVILTIGNMADGEVTTCSMELMTDPSIFTTSFFLEPSESEENWEVSNAGISTTMWSLSTANPNNGDKSWFVPDIETESDVYLNLTESFTVTEDYDNPIISVWHAYDTEATWDGGVIEYATNGSDWIDFGANMVQNGYNSIIQENPASAISGREGFSGSSMGYVNTLINVESLVGQTFSIRFRFASDGAVGGLGWYVDDVELLDAAFLTIQACAQADELPEVCAGHTATMISDFECTADAGTLVGPDETEDGIVIVDIFAQDPFLNVSVEYDGGTPSTDDYDQMFLLTENNAPTYTIKSYNQTGEFNLASLDAATYTIWSVTYSTINPVSTVGAFINNNGVTSMESFQEKADQQALCLAITNQDATGNTLSVEVQMDNTSINALQNDFNIQISPVPTIDILNIEFIAQKGENYEIEIYNIAGQLIETKTLIANTGNNQYSLKVNEYPSGIYWLSLTNETGAKSNTKFIKE